MNLKVRFGFTKKLKNRRGQQQLVLTLQPATEGLMQQNI